MQHTRTANPNPEEFMAEPDDKKKLDIEKLTQLLESFNEQTKDFETSYQKFQLEIEHLKEKLARKNEELEKNKNYLHNILESLTTGVIVVDEHNRITTFNPASGQITGKDCNESLGKTLPEVFDIDLMTPLIDRLKTNPGETVSLDRESPFGEHGISHLRASASPVRDHKGHQTGSVLLLQDMSQMKRLEEDAQRNQRLRAMGEMAAGIAHEIRNPLGGIELCASLLRKDLEKDAEKKELADSICNGVANMDRIISSILLFAKSPKPSRQQCDINALVTELMDFSSTLASPDKIEFNSDLASETLIGNADSELLKQVMLNLIRNAIQAMEHTGGQMTITTRKSAEPVISSAGTVDPRDTVSIAITDTGSGIGEDDLVRIFHPFFTTKDKGTGLGLAIAHNIIKAHQGVIDVKSRPGQGTTFVVKIPAWDEEFDEK